MGDSKEFPALGFDPAPGSVDAMVALTGRVDLAAKRMAESQIAIGRALENPGAWQGPAGAGCRNSVQHLTPYILATRNSLDAAKRGITQWAETLRGFRARRTGLEDRARAARDHLRQLEAGPDANPSIHDLLKADDARQERFRQAKAQIDAAETAVDQIHREARGLKERHTEAAKSAAGEIKKAARMISPEDMAALGLPGASAFIATDFETPPALDADLRRYDVEDPTGKDHRTLNLAKLMLAGQAGLGNPRAVQFLNHWLENTGAPVEFDPQAMIREVPGLKSEIDRAVAENTGKGRFDSQWKSGAIHEDITRLQQQGKSASPELLDWYYALNGYRYRISGDVKEVDGKIVGDIRVDVSKRYDWGNPGGQPRADIDLKFTDVPQEDLARLNATGPAQDYDVRGSTTFWVETPAPAKP